MKKYLILFCFMTLILVNAESTDWKAKKIKIKFGLDRFSFYSVVNYIGYTTRLPIVSYGNGDILKRDINITPHPETVQGLIAKAQQALPDCSIEEINNVLLIKEQKKYSSIFFTKLNMKLNNQTLKEWNTKHAKKLYKQNIIGFTDYSKNIKFTANYNDKQLNEILMDLAAKHGGTFYCFTKQKEGKLFAGIIYVNYPPLAKHPKEGLALLSGDKLLKVKAEIVTKNDIAYCKVKMHNASRQKIFFQDLACRDLFITFFAIKKPIYTPLLLFNQKQLESNFSLKPNEGKEIIFPLTDTEGYFRGTLFSKQQKQKRIIFPSACKTSNERQKYLFSLMSNKANLFFVAVKFSDSKQKQYWSKSIEDNTNSKSFLFKTPKVLKK